MKLQPIIFKLRRSMWVRSLLALVTIVLVIAVGIGIRIITYGRTITSGKYDCAIVLGAEVNGSNPSPVFQARIEHGIELYRAGIVRHLIFTGGVGSQANIAESQAARQVALANSIPDRAISIESVSTTTLGNLIESRQIIADRCPNSVILVSDPLHLRRSVDMAADLGLVATGSATPTTRYRSVATQLPFLIREIYFSLHYWLLRS
jgi:uncharacterized SAM-binding protein YcdF (DUF218 family)